MNKQEFLAELRRGLARLPQEDRDERLTFYGEMLDDRMEEGLSEEEAVAAVGPVEDIVRQAAADFPAVKSAKEGTRPKRRLRAGEIVLLVLGSPLWLPLGIAAAAVIFSLYVSLWSVIISLWTVFGALAVSAAAVVPMGVVFAVRGSGAAGLAMLAAAAVCAGLAIGLFFGCRGITAGVLALTKRLVLRIKNGFARKEDKS